MKVMKGINKQIMAEFVVMVLATKYVGEFGPAGPIKKCYTSITIRVLIGNLGTK